MDTPLCTYCSLFIPAECINGAMPRPGREFVRDGEKIYHHKDPRYEDCWAYHLAGRDSIFAHLGYDMISISILDDGDEVLIQEPSPTSQQLRKLSRRIAR